MGPKVYFGVGECEKLVPVAKKSQDDFDAYLC